MKKIKSVFQRNYETDRTIRNEVAEGCEWVLAGEGIASLKLDGACCAIFDGVFYKRYDAKHGKTPPDGFIPAQEPDPITGHWTGWVRADRNNPADKWFWEAKWNVESLIGPLSDGTYEAVGPHFQANAEHREFDVLEPHGAVKIPNEEITRTFEGLRDYLAEHYIEGIVFHRGNGDMAKIKRVDFGFEWNGKTRSSEGGRSMNQRIAAFYHYDLQGLRDEIEADVKPDEQIKDISHAMAVAWHNGGNGSPSTHLYYSAIVIFEKDGGAA